MRSIDNKDLPRLPAYFVHARIPFATALSVLLLAMFGAPVASAQAPSSSPTEAPPPATLSIDLRGGKKAAFDFLRNLRIARNAVSLGGVETLVCHPKSTTHSGFSEEEFAQAGITEGMVRISVGIEDWRDLIADFEQALDAI